MARKVYAIVGVRMNGGKVISIVLVRTVTRDLRSRREWVRYLLSLFFSLFYKALASRETNFPLIREYNWSKNHFGEIQISQGLVWVLLSLSHY